jgi:hypothetical protein
METDDTLLSVSQAAGRLGISKSAISLALNEDRLPFTSIMGRRGIRVGDLALYKPRAYAGRPGRKVGGRPKKRAAEAPVDTAIAASTQEAEPAVSTVASRRAARRGKGEETERR